MGQFEISLINTFEAETAEDAVRQMIDWIASGDVYRTGYRVLTEDGKTLFIDGDDLGED